LKFFRQNNYTEKAKIPYFLNLVYFLSLVGLWQNHVIYLPLTGLMSRYTTPFTKRVVNKYGSVCHCYLSFFYGTLHMWARIDEEHNNKEKIFTFQTWKKIIKPYPMTGRLIVTRGYDFVERRKKYCKGISNKINSYIVVAIIKPRASHFK